MFGDLKSKFSAQSAKKKNKKIETEITSQHWKSIFSNFLLPGLSDSGGSNIIRKGIENLERKYWDFFEISLNFERN